MSDVPTGVAAADVHSTLQTLAARLSADGHHLHAIKCYIAMISQSMLPLEEAATRLKLGLLLLQHTLNVQEAKQHLQHAEMLVSPLPGQHLLKCEVISALATAHKLLGEVEFERRCYDKGLEWCKDITALNSDKRCLAEWGVYFLMHLAQSFAGKGQLDQASQQVDAAASLAESHGLRQQQVLCNLFLLQLALQQWERQEATGLVKATAGLIEQLEDEQAQQQQQSPAEQQGYTATSAVQLAHLKLHHSILHLMLAVQNGAFKDLFPDPKKGPDNEPPPPPPPVPPIVQQMDQLLQQLSGGQLVSPQQGASTPDTAAHGLPAAEQQHRVYEWLPLPVMAATVQLLAAMVDKPAGKQRLGQARIKAGLQLLDTYLTVLLQDKAAASRVMPAHTCQQVLRACLSLRVLLLETRQQLHLLGSDFAAAQADAAESIRVFNQFPELLSALKPAVHLQAGLYAQAVGAFQAAVSHFLAMAEAAQQHGLLHAAADGRSLAALCYVAQETDDAVNQARDVLGAVTAEGETGLGYGSRSLRHVVSGLVQLQGSHVSEEQRADAKQQLSRALKMAHSRLHNHQLVSQVLLLLTPLQVATADTAGARQMVASCAQLSHGAGDVHTQVAAIKMNQLMLEASKAAEGPDNANYLARKQEEVSARIQAAEAHSQQHQAVLTWGLS